MTASVIANTITYTRGRIEGDKLTRALLDAAAAGQRPHCSDPETHHLWLSEHEGERAEACKLCAGCPVYVECGEAATARREAFGVWGGADRSPRAEAAAAKPRENSRVRTSPEYPVRPERDHNPPG